MNANSVQNSFTARVNPLWYWIWCGVWGTLLALMVWWSVHEASSWPVAAAVAVTLAGYALWLYRFEIRVTDARLSYTTLFGRTSTLALSDIDRTAFETGATNRDSGFYRLVLVPKRSSTAAPVKLNLTIFRGRDIGRLLELFKAHGITVDPAAWKLRARL